VAFVNVFDAGLRIVGISGWICTPLHRVDCELAGQCCVARCSLGLMNCEVVCCHPVGHHRDIPCCCKACWYLSSQSGRRRHRTAWTSASMRLPSIPVVGHLYSDRPRVSSLERCLLARGWFYSSREIKSCGRCHNLHDPLVDDLLNESGWYAMLAWQHWGVQCSTVSCARTQDGHGPPVLRSRSCPYGRPGLSSPQQRQLADANTGFGTCLSQCYLQYGRGCGFSIENPNADWKVRSLGGNFVQLWNLPAYETMATRIDVHHFDHDQCAYGLEHRKPTRLAVGHGRRAPGLIQAAWKHMSRCCSCPPGTHVPLTGRDTSGCFRTSGAAEYTEEWCNGIALAIDASVRPHLCEELLEPDS